MYRLLRAPNWNRWLPARLTVRRFALVCGLILLAMTLVAVLFPTRFYVGSLRISLRNTKNPGTACFICFAIWYLTSDRNFGRIVAGWQASLVVWKSYDRHRRLLLAALTVNAVLGILVLLQYPHHLLTAYRWFVITADSPAHEDNMDWAPNLKYFTRQIQKDLPPDARILFHGHMESIEFAYEVYPRRVFMLPAEAFVLGATWHEQRWLMGMPNDPLEYFWQRSFPKNTIDRETFIREHGITHEVYFVADDLSSCRWRAVR